MTFLIVGKTISIDRPDSISGIFGLNSEFDLIQLVNGGGSGMM